MQHLDEGTIHAWLDGALDADEGARIEAHVAACEACSAAVAEARGFIAGTSRILGALDHVPANVLPREAPRDAGAPVSRARRFRMTAPWMAAAAAVLVVAVGIFGRGASSPESPLAAQDSAVSSPSAPAELHSERAGGGAVASGSGSAGGVGAAALKAERSSAPVVATRAPRASAPAPAPSLARPRDENATRAVAGIEAKVAERPPQVASQVDSAAAIADSTRALADERLRRMTTNAAIAEAMEAAPGFARKAAVEPARNLQGCYQLPSQGYALVEATAPRSAQRQSAASAPRAQQPTELEAFVLDSTRYGGGRADADAESRQSVRAPLDAGGRVIGSWAMLSPSSARVSFDDGRAPLFLTRAPNGVMLARTANDSTQAPIVLRRCSP